MKYLITLVVIGLLVWLWRSQASAKAGDGSLPAVGAPAPGFDLADTRGVRHKLADYRGHWVVLYFYPKADTPGCTRQACNFRDDWHSFQQKGVVLVGISADKPGQMPSSHRNSICRFRCCRMRRVILPVNTVPG